jgi:hypothetical protein
MTSRSLPRLVLDPAQYPGGVGIWGALPAIYDTTTLPVEHGVHVHARRAPGRKKEIDESYSEVSVVAGCSSTKVAEASATPYVAGAVLGLPLQDVSCPFCGELHLDIERFAVHPHQRHLCQGCGVEFLEANRSIGNPIISAKRKLGDVALSRPTTPGMSGPLRLDQSAKAFEGGILIWASNPAILWTGPRQEAEGIHVHAFRVGTALPTVDETYQRVEIDGISIVPTMARVFMVQQSLPYLSGAVQALSCTKCGADHFDDAIPFAVEPHRNHLCTVCGFVLMTSAPVVSNPIVKVLARLYANALSVGLKKNPLAP